MTKAKISEYDAVASNNTDVNGVNIAENCPPSGMNNMGREIMAALKRFQVGSDGDGVTVGGNLVVSGSSTLATTAISSADINGGTIDGTAVGGASAAAGAFTTLNTSGAVVFNDAGADVDFRVEGDTDANLLFVDASADAVGIGTSSPTDTSGYGRVLDIRGSTTVNGAVIYLRNSDATVTGQLAAYGDGRMDIGTTTAHPLKFFTTNAERMRIDSAGNVGIGTSSPTAAFEIDKAEGLMMRVKRTGVAGEFQLYQGTNIVYLDSAAASGNLAFATVGTERARIDSSGNLLVGKTSAGGEIVGATFLASGYGVFTRNSAVPFDVNRLGNDGTLLGLYQETIEEGSISVSGSTVSYNGGHLSRWAQLTTPKDDTPLFKGTVMSNLDEMNVYIKPTLYWTEEDKLPVDEEGNPTFALGDVKEETSVSDNEQLNKVKVSDVEGDPNVAGVFVNWTHDEAHDVDEINMAMTGDMIIRIAQGVTVARGDLLMSAGDGTAKPQGDDIVRSKTIAKVTSTHVTCTYDDDGSYCVPCVLMAC